MTGVLIIAALLAVPQHPLEKDKTGVDWVLPFDAAQEKSLSRNRILMIKPVAFGTSSDGGW